MAGELVCKLLPAPVPGSVAYAVCLSRSQLLRSAFGSLDRQTRIGQKRLAIPGPDRRGKELCFAGLAYRRYTRSNIQVALWSCAWPQSLPLLLKPDA